MYHTSTDYNSIYRAMDTFNFSQEYKVSSQLEAIRILLSSNFRHQAMPTQQQLQARLTQLRGGVGHGTQNFHEINDIYLEAGIGALDDEYAHFRDRHKINGTKLSDMARDEHNVHNSAINNTVKEVIVHLFEDFPTDNGTAKFLLEQVKNTLRNRPKWTGKAANAISFIEKSDVHFNINVTLRQMVASVVAYARTLDDAEVQDELYRRLAEELHEMDGKCSTGYMSRIASVLQGYTDNPRYIFTVDIEKVVKQAVRNFLTDSLRTAGEEVIDGIVDRTPAYIEYIDSVSTKHMDAWVEAYGEENREHIETIISEFKQIQ